MKKISSNIYVITIVDNINESTSIHGYCKTLNDATSNGNIILEEIRTRTWNEGLYSVREVRTYITMDIIETKLLP